MLDAAGGADLKKKKTLRENLIRLFPARRRPVALFLCRIQPPAGAVPSTQTETAQ